MPRSKLSNISLMFFTFIIGGCSAYDEADYANKATVFNENEKLLHCKNMEPAQKEKCQERERQLSLQLGANSNCTHRYEYQRKHCLSLKAQQKEQLDESLKKHKK